MKNVSEEYHIHIEGGNRRLGLNLKEVWGYRDLIGLFTKRNMTLTYKQTVLGPVWLVLAPLLTSVVYAAVFSGIAGISTEGVPALLFYLCSHGLWAYFAACLRRNSTTFLDNARIFGKVYFPRLAISVSTMLTAFIEFLIEFAMIIILLVVYMVRGSVEPTWYLLILLPVIVLQTGLMGMGVGILISSLTTKYRDLVFLLNFGLSLWMYATPVVYPLAQLNGMNTLYYIMLFNPMTAPMELFRKIMLGQGCIDPISIASTVIFTLAVVIGGILIFNKVERTFIDTV